MSNEAAINGAVQLHAVDMVGLRWGSATPGELADLADLYGPIIGELDTADATALAELAAHPGFDVLRRVRVVALDTISSAAAESPEATIDAVRVQINRRRLVCE